MKILKARKSFTASNRILFEGRNERMSSLLGEFTYIRSVSSKNKKLNELAVELVKNGYYATPANFNPDIPSTLRFVRQGIGSHIFKEWRLKKSEKKIIWTSRIDAWQAFCEQVGWEPMWGTWTTHH